MRELVNYGAVSVQTRQVAFSTVYAIRCQDVSGSVKEWQTDDVATMLRRVRTCQELTDSVDIVVTRYRQTGLELSRPVQVVKYSRGLVPAPARLSLVSGGQDLFEFDGQDVLPVRTLGKMLGCWKTVQAWPIKNSGKTGLSIVSERERILTEGLRRRSERTGNKYRGTIPAFSLDNVDDLFVLAILTESDKLEFETTDSDGNAKTIRYNPIRTNYYRKHADRFDRDGYDGSNVQDIARGIFATVWLESRQRFPDTWTAVTYRERYIGTIRSARWIQARINRGLSYNNSEEWKGRESVEKLTICENETHFILLLSSYAMARAIQEIVQPFKMEQDDMHQLKTSDAQAITLENFDILTEFEKSVAELLMTDHTERQAAEKLGVERTQIRQAKMRLRDKLSEFE